MWSPLRFLKQIERETPKSAGHLISTVQLLISMNVSAVEVDRHPSHPLATSSRPVSSWACESVGEERIVLEPGLTSDVIRDGQTFRKLVG